MFVQIIQGQTDDREGLQRQVERWTQELMPGATGYLGSTGGVTSDGRCIFMARFDSAESAEENSSRTEQGNWWNETEKYFSSEVTFRNCTDVETFLAGGSDSAGFVQVMQGRIIDRDRLRRMDQEMLSELQTARPDVIGSIRAVSGNDEYTEFVYFTSEAEARANEAQTMSDEQSEMFEQWQQVARVEQWYDLSDPWLISP